MAGVGKLAVSQPPGGGCAGSRQDVGGCGVGAWSGGCALVGAGPPMHASCFRGRFLHSGVSGVLLELGQLGGHILIVEVVRGQDEWTHGGLGLSLQGGLRCPPQPRWYLPSSR